MKTTSLFLLLLFIKGILLAQAPKISFEHLSMRNGLPSDYVGQIFQDDKGYIWLVNQKNIVRYDGYHMKSYFINVKDKRTDINNYVTTMFQDSHKTLWVSNYGGNLFRYDPVLDSLIIVKKGRNKTAEGLYAPIAFSDGQNHIWSIYGKSPSDFFLEQFSPLDKSTRVFGRDKKGKNLLAADQALSFFNSPSGDILLCSNNGFYNYDYKDERFINYLTVHDSLKALRVYGIYREPSGDRNIWLIANTHQDTTTRLYRYNLQSQQLKACVKLSGKPVLTTSPIFKDKKGRLWLFTQTGLFLYDEAAVKVTEYPTPPVDKNLPGEIRDILVDKDNVFWIATNAGLLYFNPATGQFQRYKANQSDPYALAHIHVVKVFEDRSGLKWVGMDEYGVDRINTLHSAFTGDKHNPDKPGSYPENVTGIALKPDGNYWLTTQQGLFNWNVKENIFTRVTPPTKTQNEYCSSPCLLSGGTLCYWDDAGLNLYDRTGKIQTIKIPGKEQFSHFYKDNEDNIWVLTDKGAFYMFNKFKKVFERYRYVGQSGGDAKIDTVSAITSSEVFEDKNGTLWISSSKTCLSKVDRVKKQVIIMAALQGKVLSDITVMYQDKTGSIWLGTNENGFWQFNAHTEKLGRRITDDQGILSKFVSGIAEDKSGNLWIATQTGLVKFNYKSDVVLDYTVADDIPLEVPIGLLTTPDGHIVLCMFNSILTFNPDDIKSNPIAPQVQVESVVYSNPGKSEKDDHVVNGLITGNATISYDENRVTFNYVALHFVDPARNRYAYMLENYDKTWIQAQGQRAVTYNNLAPGTYTFRVKASNSDGVWNNKGATFVITIKSPWWSRWWAWLLYVVLSVSAIYGFITYRSRRLIHQNKILEQRIALRTGQLSEANEELQAKQDEITSQRDQLVETLDELKNTQSQLLQREKMASLGELTAGIAHEIQNPLNFVNNFSEVSVELIAELKSEEANGNTIEVMAIADDLTQNLQKIQHHGKRADAIVKGMLEHSRAGTGQKEPTNINNLADEYLRLAFHGLRAKDKEFNAELITHFEEKLPKVNAVPQDMGRVFLNLFNNAFYAVNQKKKTAGAVYKPEVSVSTSTQNGQIIIKVKDNGIGIPDAIKEKIMQPFFTTKPTGEGTGLGLSLTYDMVVKGHGGKIDIDSKQGEFTIFTISLPIG